MERLIFHIDVNSAFLSWESARRIRNGEPDLRLIPAAIGGDADKRTGIILAKSIPAKQYGITTGEPVSMALRKCPNLVLAKPDFSLYLENSAAFLSVCKKYAPVVEQFSIDECFLDMTGTNLLYPDPIATAYEIKDEIRNTLGFTVNIGISTNKLLAKMASDFEKPDRVHTLFPAEIPSKMWPLPVGDLFTVGHATAEKLIRHNINTIGELAKTDPVLLQNILGPNMGLHAHQYANGIEQEPVRSEREEAKGYSISTTLEENITSERDAHAILTALGDSVAARMRADGKKTCCIGVTIRGSDFSDRSHQKKLSAPTDVTREIVATAKELFSDFHDGRAIRLLGISLTDLSGESGEQLSLFPDAGKERLRKMDRTLDSLRTRFGQDIIAPASAMHSAKQVGRKYKAQLAREKELPSDC